MVTPSVANPGPHTEPALNRLRQFACLGTSDKIKGIVTRATPGRNRRLRHFPAAGIPEYRNYTPPRVEVGGVGHFAQLLSDLTRHELGVERSEC